MASKDDLLVLIETFELLLCEVQMNKSFVTMAGEMLRSVLFCPNDLIPEKIKAEINVEKDCKLVDRRPSYHGKREHSL